MFFNNLILLIFNTLFKWFIVIIHVTVIMCTPWIELVLMWGLCIGQTKHYKFKPFWKSYVGVMKIRWLSNFQWKQFIHTVESFDFVGANFVDILPICGDVILWIHGFSFSVYLVKKLHPSKFGFMEDVNLLERATNEYHEKWATTSSNDSIVDQRLKEYSHC